MKLLFCLIFILPILICRSQKVNGQVMFADIGVNGLTCSQCTRTVEMSIRKLDFVNDVQMNLEQTSGHIIFKQGTKVDLEDVADAIFRAGFSVRYMNAQIGFDTVAISNGSCHQIKGQYFQFVHTASTTLYGRVIVKLEGKKFMPSKEYRKVKAELKPKCSNSAQKEFFISLL